MKLFISILVIALFISINESFATPRFALRMHDRCIDCHMNPTGGGQRNLNGFHYGKNILSMISPREKDFKLSPQLTDNIYLGLDYRMQYLFSQELGRTDFQDMSGNIYFGVELSDKISAQGRYDFVNFIWEGFAVAKIFPNDSYIKFGTFQPNFGIRLDDHTAFTRGGDFAILNSQGPRGLFYDPFYRETGLEFGLNFSKISNLTFSVGRPSTSFRIFGTDPTYTARFELTPRIKKLGFLFGGSVAKATIPQETKIFGGFAGIGYKYLTLMGEYDIGEDYVADGTRSNFILLKANYQLMVGLEAELRYDMIDPNTDVEDDETSRVIVGLEFFPYSFIEIRPQFRYVIEEPELTNNSFVLQFHVWY